MFTDFSYSFGEYNIIITDTNDGKTRKTGGMTEGWTVLLTEAELQDSSAACSITGADEAGARVFVMDSAVLDV